VYVNNFQWHTWNRLKHSSGGWYNFALECLCSFHVYSRFFNGTRGIRAKPHRVGGPIIFGWYACCLWSFQLKSKITEKLEDNAIGISSEINKKFFNFFFIAKPIGEETDLKFSIS